MFEILLQTTPFGPVPTPTPTPLSGAGGDDVSRTTLYLIALAVLVAIVAIGYLISRDARRSLTAEDREALEQEKQAERGAATDLTVDQRERRARDKKQRSKAKAARRARRHNRP